jgi:UBX domain
MRFLARTRGAILAMMVWDSGAVSSSTTSRSFIPLPMSLVQGDISSEIVHAALSVLRGGDTNQKAAILDLRTDLSELYGIKEDNSAITSSNETCSPITTNIVGGSFKEALLLAKQQGRLLMIFIPQLPPPSNKNKLNDSNAIDAAVMKAFLSPSVSQMAERAPPKKKSSKAATTPQTNGSFLLWTSTSGMGSKEVSLILKRIQGGTVQRSNAAGQKRPLLLVVYPHSDVRSGEVVPVLVAQHHCTPPPDGTKLGTWLQTLRQRSGKYYATLQKQQQELLWQQERVKGYQKSIQSDVQLKEQRIQEALEQRRLKEEEERRLQQIQERRNQFLELLNEVTVSDGDANEKVETGPITTVALRFGDGRTGTRRFTSSATIQDIFRWVDAEFSIECETVLLQSMNGQRTFEWYTDDESNRQVKLSDVGLGKMFGLRVTTKTSSKLQPKPIQRKDKGH